MILPEVSQASFPSSSGQRLRLAQVLPEMQHEARQLPGGREGVRVLVTELSTQALERVPQQRICLFEPAQLSQHRRQVHAQDQGLAVRNAARGRAAKPSLARHGLCLVVPLALHQQHAEIGGANQDLVVVLAQDPGQAFVRAPQQRLGLIQRTGAHEQSAEVVRRDKGACMLGTPLGLRLCEREACEVLDSFAHELVLADRAPEIRPLLPGQELGLQAAAVDGSQRASARARGAQTFRACAVQANSAFVRAAGGGLPLSGLLAHDTST
mmetsp:Transcript_32314/g.106656  ORF Transcript_32314/g.106656 Transcript_32314/m.106656 type:complete len:268 (+) Transcript_32314:1101-1904(+)